VKVTALIAANVCSALKALKLIQLYVVIHMSESVQTQSTKSEGKKAEKQASLRLVVDLAYKWYRDKLKELEHVMRLYGVTEVLGALANAEKTLEDLWYLILKNVEHFKFEFRYTYAGDNKVWEVSAIGEATEFSTRADPNTPITEVIERILSDEEQIRNAVAEAFTALRGVASKLRALLNFARELEELKQKIDMIKATVENIKEYCGE